MPPSPVSSPRGHRNEVAKGIHKSRAIDLVIDNEFRDRFRGIHRKIPALVNDRIHVQAVSLQAGKQLINMRLSRDNDCCISCLERSPDEPGHVLGEVPILRVQNHFVTARRRPPRWSEDRDLAAVRMGAGLGAGSFVEMVSRQTRTDKALATENRPYGRQQVSPRIRLEDEAAAAGTQGLVYDLCAAVAADKQNLGRGTEPP